MSSQSSVRKRKDNSTSLEVNDSPLLQPAAIHFKSEDEVKVSLKNDKEETEWDYKLALAVLTVLGFVTRFWGISHPSEVVFDEVHFGKVSHNIQRFYFSANSCRLVCISLFGADLLFRCAPTTRKASLCINGLVRWIRWPLSLRKHWGLVHYQQSSICCLPFYARLFRSFDYPFSISYHVGVWIYSASLHFICMFNSFRQRSHRTNTSHTS